ncbi:hypothetical protein HYU90_02905 [Candidatus Collierbacteria bacterium]|nr:hypothetical protein [Candidatus Collierbacteria bacterium]
MFTKKEEWGKAKPVYYGPEKDSPKDRSLEEAFNEEILRMAGDDRLQGLSYEFSILQKAAQANLYSNEAEDGAIIEPERFVLKNPRRMGLQNLSFGSLVRSAQPEVNSRTGDLRWEPSQGNRFASILPKIEITSAEPRSKAVGNWTYRDLMDFLKAIGDISIDLEEMDWSRRSSEEKRVKLASMLANRSKAVEDYGDKFPTETEEAKRRLGVEVTEVGPDGEVVETFSIYIARNPKYTNVLEYRKLTGQNGGEQEWQVVVRCASGNETIYNWGSGDGLYNLAPLVRKPVIYLYPTQPTQISVDLDFTRGPVVVEYPKRENGTWKVEAQPDGRLLVGDKEYPYLFWEAKPTTPYQFDQTEGFCLAQEEFVPFFEEKLEFLGLNDKEITDFITYWYPQMKSNQYTYVNFLGKEYLDSARLTVSPKPESSIRVFVVFRSMAQKVNLKFQEMTKGQRSGFTLVEWGGSNLDEK